MKRKLLKGLLTGVFLAMAHWGLAQKTITGKVTDSSTGDPIPGVSVSVKGTTNATATDAKGMYSIEVAGDSTKLVFTFIGMNTEEILMVGAGTALDVSMIPSLENLMEVVVVGYGKQEQAYVTGSISKVKGEEIRSLPVTSYDQAIQGRAPGVLIEAPSGELGAAMRIRVRGASSVTASNQPFIVIDGIPVTTDPQSNFTDNTPNNPMADLNPNDIESVEVLKDAAAAAIYGARASNGVILITTKRGAAGKTKFNMNFATGISEPTNVRKFLNRSQYIQMFTDASKNGGYTATDYGTDSAALDNAWNDYAGTSPSFTQLVKNGTDDNWNKNAYRTGSTTQFDFNASGGTEKTKFLASFGYLNQQGIIKRNSLERFSGRFNLDHTINKYVGIGLSTNQVFTNNGRVPENNSFGSPLQGNAISPLIPLKDPTTGDDNSNTFYGNPYLALNNSTDNANTIRNLTNMYGTLKIIKDLVYRTEFGFDLLSMTEKSWNGSKVPNSVATPSSGNYGTTNIFNYTTNNTLTYTKLLGKKHNLEALIGYSFQKSNGEYSYIQGQGLPTDDLHNLANASQITSASSSTDEFAYTSAFARLNYRFDNKYLLGASLRYDGSSRFGKNNLYGYFPAVSVGWILTEEEFFKNFNVSNLVNFVKIKSSFGLTGNSSIGNYDSRGLYNSSFWGSRGGLYPRQLENKDLSWETTRQWDIGIEYSVLKDRVSGGFDYYIKYTPNLLLSKPIPSTSGYASQLRNIGGMENKGFEIYVTTKNLVKKFKWSTTFNFSSYKNTVLNLDGQSILPNGRELNGVIEGQPLSVFYGVKYAGVDPANGDALYELADGSTTSNYSIASQSQNLKVLGSPHPKNFGGISNTFSYMGVDLTIFGQWVYGNQIYNSSGIFQSSNMASFGLDNQTADQMNYWKNPGDQTNVPRPDLSVNNGSRTSSRWLYDGSYFRFKTVTLGYTLPESIVSKIKFSSIRIYVTAQNLFTITNYPGNDPEVNYTTPSATTQTVNRTMGIDYYSAPQARSIVVGINLGF